MWESRTAGRVWATKPLVYRGSVAAINEIVTNTLPTHGRIGGRVVGVTFIKGTVNLVHVAYRITVIDERV